jgi:5-methylcytosine-specific restriction endonuclease McrA
LLDHLGCVIDHVVAHARGGGDALTNFAVACNKCNIRKSAADKAKYLAEHPPRPVKGKYGEPRHWDGLASLFIVLARKPPPA